MRAPFLAAALALAAGAAHASPPAPPTHPGAPSVAGSPSAPRPDLAAAVAACRHVDPDRLPAGEREQTIRRWTEAIRTLGAAGEDGVRAVEAELTAMRAAGETDVLFQSTASEVILGVRQEAGFPAAAEALRGVDARKHLRHLWPSLSVAAQSRAPAALPLLRMVLATDAQSAPTSFPQHGMEVPWPYTLDFLYVPFGQGACEDLLRLAGGPPSPAQDDSIAYVLPRLACPAAAGAMRTWATSASPRRAAAGFRALGELGEPGDAPLLSGCVKHADPLVRRACAYGLWELSMPATLPAARTLLRDPDEKVRLEALSLAFHLPEEATLAEAIGRGRDAKDEEAERLGEMIMQLAAQSDVPKERLAAGDAAALRKAAEEYWKRRDHHFDLRAGDRPLTRAELDEALARWEKSGHVGGERAALSRAVLAVSRPDDAAAILRARGQVLLRQSDECLPDAQFLERVLRVVRRRALGHPKPNE